MVNQALPKTLHPNGGGQTKCTADAELLTLSQRTEEKMMKKHL